ncbi:MAG TPA: TonB family protein [Candidatus Acidoferrales bacterium]|jgi:periplasmic protein TonB|nr:TonB family protein [Candidatus Acidoferrales bacterium]
MRRKVTVKAAMSLLLCGSLLTCHTAQSKVSQDSLTQKQTKTFSGKIVSQNGVRYVLRDDDNSAWYHLDDQEKAGKLVGKDVLVTGTFDGLTGTIRVQSIVESAPHPKPAANTEEMKQDSEPAKPAATPPATADAVAPGAQQSAPAEEPVNEAPAPPSDPRISAGTEVSHQPHSELSGAPAREVLPASFLTLPEEAVSSSSSIAISSRRSVPMPSGLKPETQSSKDVLAGRLLKRVDPSYPQEAMQQRIEGTVRLHVVIGDDGKVLTLEPVSGPPLLVDAAVVAIHQWRYGPTLFDGHRVQVQEDVRLVFRLPD